jgi:hypothetical protein
MIRQYTTTAPWAATQNENGQPKKLNVSSREKNTKTKLTANQTTNRMAVTIKFFLQYRSRLVFRCIGTLSINFSDFAV